MAAAERRRADSIALFTLRSVANTAFGTGERLVFDVNYGFITAGEAASTRSLSAPLRL